MALVGLLGAANVGSCAGEDPNPPEKTPAVCVDDSDCVDDDPCTYTECDLQAHRCAVFASGGKGCACVYDEDCNDALPCTIDDCAGAAGVCEHEKDPTVSCPCRSAADCDDSDPCTENVCGDDQTGFMECAWKPNGTCGSGGGGGAGGEGQGGAGGASTDCDGDGMCEMPMESCDCAECKNEPECGAGCEQFSIVGVQWGNGFFEALISAIEGAGDDSLQGNGFGGLTVGTHQLVEPTGFSDCTASPCLAVAADGFTSFWQGVSGTVETTSTSPPEATLKNVKFHPRTADANGKFIIDKTGKCYFLKEGKVPTP